MPSISRDDLERSVNSDAFNVRSTHSILKEQEVTRVGRRKKDRRRSADDTAKLIKKYLAKQSGWVRLLDICDHLERSPGPHLRAILEDMIAQGLIDRTVDDQADRMIPRFLYRSKK